MNDAAGPDISGLPVKDEKHKAKNAGGNGLPGCLCPGKRSGEIRTNDVCSTENQGAAHCAENEYVFLIPEAVNDGIIDEGAKSHLLEQPDKDEHQKHDQRMKRHVIPVGSVCYEVPDHPEGTAQESKDPEAQCDLDDIPG